MSALAQSCALLLVSQLLLIARVAHGQSAPRADADVSAGNDGTTPLEEESHARPEGKRNKGMLVVGIVASGLGGLGLTVGAVSFALAGASNTEVCNNGSCRPATESDRSDMRTAGWVGVISGTALLAVGIPLIVIGAKRRPVQEAQETAGLRLHAIPGGGSLRLTF